MKAGMQIQITCIDNGFLVAVPGDRTGREGMANYFEQLKEALDYIEVEFGEKDFSPKISD